MPLLPLAFLIALVLLPLAARPAAGQALPLTEWSDAVQVIVPQRRAFPLGRFGEAMRVESVAVKADVVGQAATTTIEVVVRNPGSRDAEAVMVLPIPGGATVTEFSIGGAKGSGRVDLLRREEARRVYDGIVSRSRDPGLLEFAGTDALRSSVFPVPARGTQRLTVSFEHLLERNGTRTDYTLPRSEALDVEARWSIEVRVRAEAPIATLYSPSHELSWDRLGPKSFTARLRSGTLVQPGAFLLSWLLEGEGVAASLYAFADDEEGGGWFLLLAGAPSRAADAPHVPREVTIVLDRSGSMAGEKMDQAGAAALQVIEGLEDGEAFNLIDYATTVERFAPEPVVKTPETTKAARAYLGGLRPSGGTNLHGALAAALAQPSRPGMLPIVLFLTDGLPTVGQTDEPAIRAIAAGANPHQRRLFAFGVGADVNVPLLDKIADECRGLATYALPGEDVEVKVAQVFARLQGPVLSDVVVTARGASGPVATPRIRELVPERLPDLYEDGQVVLLGRWIGDDPLAFEIAGDEFGARRVTGYSFDLHQALSPTHAFVPRLWASRRIAYLVDEVRQLGGATSGLPVTGGPTPDDPRIRELVDEIVRLSTRFGVLTEYTAFLATEGAELANYDELMLGCRTNLEDRAVRVRSGLAAVSQGRNFNRQKVAAQVDYYSSHWTGDMSVASIDSGVLQLCDRALFRRGDRWIDGRLAGADETPNVTIEWGTPAWQALAERLAREGRAGLLALHGEVLLRLDGRTVLVRGLAPDGC